jgi:hypothetical protein
VQLRGFTCSQAKVDPKVASPAEAARMRAMAIGHQMDRITEVWWRNDGVTITAAEFVAARRGIAIDWNPMGGPVPDARGDP